jgi:hypothetical protein
MAIKEQKRVRVKKNWGMVSLRIYLESRMAILPCSDFDPQP